MERRSYTKILLQPSVSSAVCSIVLTVIIIAAANWNKISESLFFHEYISGPDRVVSLGNIFSSPGVNNVLIVIGALIIGGTFYFLLQSRQYITQGRDAWQLQEAARLRGERRQRMHIRLIVLASWVAFSIFCIKLFVPFCLLASEVGLEALWQWQGILYLLFGTLLLWFILHVHVIFARLFLLRLRVFGGNQTIIS